jgi:ubiquinone/menaquinone biosynthesis C-methylase UbiE
MNIDKFQEHSEKATKFYDDSYYSDATTDVRVSSHLRRLAKKVDISMETEILDVACGTGNWLMAAREAGAIPFGIDISEKAIEICKQVMAGGTFICGGADSLPFEDKKFDFVSCLGALEHFPDISQSLEEIVRVAKDDACFLLLVPNSGFLTARLGLYSGTHQTEVKEEVHTIEEWEQLFYNAGLKVDKKWKDLHVLSWGWISKARIWGIPLRALQALLLWMWPLRWQYQVYFFCVKA